VKLYKTKEWHEDFGDCLFFHFYDFESPPKVFVGVDSDLDFTDLPREDWTHFVKIDFNSIIKQAKGEE
jgi:hypothetical protein